MGVMACSREGCDNILCNILILGGTTYICKECLHELEQTKATWPEETSVGDVKGLILEFLATEKGSQFPSTDPEDVEAEFRRLIG